MGTSLDATAPEVDAVPVRPSPLTPDELAAGLADLPDWRVEDGRLERELEFADFDAAFAFMQRVAAHARRLDHHPDWSNSYAKVSIALKTHDVGALTRLDLDLARAIDGCVGGGG
jgi:4a-hydroxytetrahydrobiopterin dehydratase